MLKSLSIQNIVLIEKSDIEFSNQDKNGLYIFTGETGSGKSLLLNAIGLVAGKRGSLRYIADTSKKATIQAEFDISDNLRCKKILAANDLTNDENENIVSIRRIIHKSSSNKAYVNDQSIGGTLHSQISETLVEIHGQFETSALLLQSNHVNILDQFAKNEAILAKLKDLHREIKENQRKLREFEEKRDKYLREKDYLLFVIKELETADIKDGEEKELLSQRNSLKNKDRLLKFLQDLKSSLQQSNENIYNSQNLIIKNQDLIDDTLEDSSEYFTKMSEDIDKLSENIDDNISQITKIVRYSQNYDFDISDIEDRLFEIKNLSRKFNTQSDQLYVVKEESQKKLKALEDQDKVVEEVNSKIILLSKEYEKFSQEIYEKREKSAKNLSKKVEDELAYLNMKSVKFKVDVAHDAASFHETGKDKVAFYAAINDDKFDFITKIASGGELSRFMLALKISLMNIKSTPTMVFDEIDTGIGGNTAHAVGNRLAKLAEKFQILVVTHQAQIAAKSSTHFCIKKEKINNKVKTTIEKLDKNCQYKEVARMISGEKITDESLAAAKKLFN